MNNIMKRALISPKLPFCLESSGLHRTDGKRPDGIMVKERKDLHLGFDLPGHLCPLLLSQCHQGGRGSSSAGRGEEGDQVCQPHPRASLLPNHSGDNGCSWPTHQGAPQGPRSAGDPDNRGGGSYHLPRPEAVSGSAARQLCLVSDGHQRPT